MRLVSQQVNECLGNTISPQSNFGLFFNKWLDYRAEGGTYVPYVAKDRSPLVKQAKHSSRSAANILKRHHIHQAEYCQSMEKAGWKSFVFTARLDSPFVSGLGAAHPTETGMVLDHTSGMPYVPAASQKGVLRIAHMINALLNEDGTEKSEEQLLGEGVITGNGEELYWEEDDASRTLYGYSDKDKALAGQLVVLDAYPLKAPELGEEILNPHYTEYYQGNRGPTEDQSPIPVKFLVVKPGAEFVFRTLLRLPYDKAPLQDQEKLSRMVNKNIRRAITEIGMGAKTALGFGRFSVIRNSEPEEMEQWIKDCKAQRTKAEQQLQNAIIDKKYPWHATLRQLGDINDWGALKDQVLANTKLCKYRSEKQVGEAVCRIAENVARRHRKKWSSERDRAVADWLQPSGIAWQPLAREATAEQQPVQKTDTQLLETITNFSSEKKEGWNQYREAKIKINKLDKQCAEALKKKFSQWGLRRSKNKAEKKAFNNLAKRLKAL